MGGTQVQVVEKRRKIPDLGAIDMRFRPLLEKMLQPLPDKRPESMAAVAASTFGSSGFLRGLKSGDAAKPSARSAKVKPADSGKRSWRYAVAAILLTAIIAGGGAGYYYYGALLPFLNPSKRPIVETRLDPAGPTQTDPSAPPSVSSTEKIKRYIEQYDGGECFFITPIAVGETRATIEGLGASVQPFSVLDAAFKRDNGFEADISVRQVTQPQCPAVTFLNRLRDERARAPRLDIDKVSLRNGETLAGLVDRFGSRNIELLLVSDSGTVQNVSHQLKPGTDAKTFSIGMQDREGSPGSQPQLLIAVASPRPLDALKTARAVAAGQFFPGVLNEAQRTGQALGVMARYFKLER
jgi:serine/threonine-protein kinase